MESPPLGFYTNPRAKNLQFQVRRNKTTKRAAQIERDIVDGAVDAAPVASKADDALSEVGRVEVGAPTKALSVLKGSCFTARTPTLTPNGPKSIERFKVGDEILSRPEHDRTSDVRIQTIERVFELSADILELRLRGRTIETTAEHPFFVENKGWVKASHLELGDLIIGHDDHQTPLEAVFWTNRHETVYNLRVSQDHTYFVGDADWGFSAWVHNAYSIRQAANGTWEVIDGAGDVVRSGLTKDRANLFQNLFDQKTFKFEVGPSSGILKMGDGVLHADDIYVQGESMLPFIDDLRKIADNVGVDTIISRVEFLNFALRDRLVQMGIPFQKVGDGPFGEIWEIVWKFK